MRLLSLPQPPNPSEQRYRDVKAYLQAHYGWAQQVVGLLQDHSRVNDAPCANPVLPTDSVSTVINALTQKGLLSPTANRNSNV